MTDSVLVSPLVQSIGWALVHFVWEGTLIGAATAGALSTIDRQRASTRYLVACTGLALMLMIAVASAFTQRPAHTFGAISLSASKDIATAVSIDRVLPVAVALWVVGVALLSLRLIAACIGVERLKRATREVDQAVTGRLGTLTWRLGIRTAVRVRVSDRVHVPTVVGCLRPVILLPVSVITGLPAAHLDAVLAHELAHVRRYDYLVNALQVLVETLLFYHPAVWWCSRQIRIERELCCDDLVVEACGDRIGYATALAQLEELRGLEPMLSVNVTGGRLIDRIRRVLGHTRVSERGVAGRWMIVAALPLVVIALVVTPVMTSAAAVRGIAAQGGDIALQEPAPAPPLPPTPPAAPAPAPPVPRAVPSGPPAAPAAPAPAAPQLAPAVPPAAPAPPVPQSVPPVPPAAPAPPAPPPDVFVQFDPESIAEQLRRASRQLTESFEELRRAAEEIHAKQEALHRAEAELAAMRTETLAHNQRIEALRKAMAELSARSATLRDGADMAELRRRLESIRRAFEELGAR